MDLPAIRSSSLLIIVLLLIAGNPRNKVALQPGHSLMDWIRLGTSGKDLTGLGARAGTLTVTKQELAKHNKQDDAWLAIRGKVYNITEYFSFHPGGTDELMRGAGIDATDLFDQVGKCHITYFYYGEKFPYCLETTDSLDSNETLSTSVHSWVNYEQILQKCLVGRLVSIDPSIDTEALFFGKKTAARTVNSAGNQVEVSSANSLGASLTSTAESIEESLAPLPRFDWIQKLDFITIFFYTKAFSNPLVEINCPVEQQTALITLAYDDTIFKNELVFHNKVEWPCDVNVTVETGKVELIFKKSESGIWDNYGVLRQQSNSINNISAGQVRASYILNKKNAINYNTWLLKFDRDDRKRVVYPIGRHVRVFGNVNGSEMSRSYTPIPECIFDNFLPYSNKKNSLCLMIKRYSDGIMSRFITDKTISDKVNISRPLGRFDLKTIEKKDSILMLAAGTGITPMLGLILFLLERRIKKCQFVRLLFFNKSEKDILFRTQLEELSQMNQRFQIDNILSEAYDDWNGLRGHVTADLVAKPLKEHLKDTGYTIEDIFAFVCGPANFNTAALEVLKNVSILEDQVHVFEG